MYTLDFLTNECKDEFIRIFGDDKFSIQLFIHSYVDFKSQGGKLIEEHILAIIKGANTIANRRNNIYGMNFIYFPPTEFGKEVLSMHIEFEEVDPESWEDSDGNIHSTFDYTLECVQKALPDWNVHENCGGIDIDLIG